MYHAWMRLKSRPSLLHLTVWSRQFYSVLFTHCSAPIWVSLFKVKIVISRVEWLQTKLNDIILFISNIKYLSLNNIFEIKRSLNNSLFVRISEIKRVVTEIIFGDNQMRKLFKIHLSAFKQYSKNLEIVHFK
jgi:hypothetical protein